MVTPEKARIIGRKAGVLFMAGDPRLADWDIFSRTLGFYRWKTKHKLDKAALEAFEQGFKETLPGE